LRLAELDRVVNVAENSAQAVLVLHIELEVGNHAEVVDELRDRLVQLVEGRAAHQAVCGGRIAVLSVVLVVCCAARGVFVDQIGVDLDKALHFALGDLPLDQIHLAQDIEVGHLEHEHGAHGGQCSGEELGAIDDKSGLEEVRGAHADVQAAVHERLDKVGQDGHVGVELDLAGHVEDDQIVVGDFLERVGQEVEVLHEELEAVDEAAVGAEAHFVHDILETDEVLDVEVGLKGKVLGGGVEVHVEAGALVVLEVLDEGGAEGRLARAGGALEPSAMLFGV
jgi:hypothetical protein